MPDEFGHETRGRPVVERVGVVPLVQMALVHDADHVADGKGFQLVVGDEERRRARRLEDGAHFVRQALAQVHVEVGKRFVEQQQARARRQRTRQGHALLLAAREFVRVACLHAVEAHELEHLGHAFFAFVAGKLGDAKADVARDVQVGEERVVLEHHADAPLFGRHVVLPVAHRFALQGDAAAAGPFQPRHGAQQRGLATARRADQHTDVAGTKAERHTVHRGRLLAGVAHAELGDVEEHG